MSHLPKRSNEPIFWGLFGAGGMWSALISPAIILCIGLGLPFVSQHGDTSHLTTIIDILRTWYGKLFALLVIILPLWCAFHRIHHCLHDMKIHLPASQYLCYGLATIVSLLAVIGVFRY